MGINPNLRSEFLIPGLAILASLLWLIAAISHRAGEDLLLHRLQEASSAIGQGATVVLVVLVTVGAAYTLGIVAVMITFQRLGKRLVASERENRLKQLRKLAGRVRLKERCAYSGENHLALARHLDDAFIRDDGFDMDLLISVGRSQISEGLIREYEYRRSVRQISSGVMLAVPPATVALGLTDWEEWVNASVEPWLQIAIFLAALGVGVVTFFVLRGTVRYQEQVAQSLLVDAAFIEYLRWKMPIPIYDALVRVSEESTKAPGVIET